MDYLTALLASNLPPWCVLGVAALFVAGRAWRDWLAHKAGKDWVEKASEETLAKYPPPVPPPQPIKTGTDKATTALVILLLVGSILATAAARQRLALLKSDCGPCPPPAACTPQGCRGVGKPLPPAPAQQETSAAVPKKTSDLAGIAWPAAYESWRPGML